LRGRVFSHNRLPTHGHRHRVRRSPRTYWRRKVATWLLGQAADWLALAGVDHDRDR
jgi:hypothetical protein